MTNKVIFHILGYNNIEAIGLTIIPSVNDAINIVTEDPIKTFVVLSIRHDIDLFKQIHEIHLVCEATKGSV